ncbi:PQQ-binding-like beta-propeller repeat protein [Haloplanus sp. GCM10025708]
MQARSDETLRWQFFEQYARFSETAVVGSALFVGTDDGRLYAFAEPG